MLKPFHLFYEHHQPVVTNKKKTNISTLKNFPFFPRHLEIFPSLFKLNIIDLFIDIKFNGTYPHMQESTRA